MPCRNDDFYVPPMTSASVKQSKSRPVADPDVPAWMLCEAMTIIEKLCKRAGGDFEHFSVDTECSAQLLAWWKAHQEGEEDRVREEAANKLTERERLALGIDECGQPTRTRVIKPKKSKK